MFSLASSGSGIFGNFGSYWFYILAVVNGILICLPNLENKIYRLCLFIGRSITFAYTCYFFIVFLPFLPLSVIAIVAIGTGFLMLTPVILFLLHINELSKDFKYLNLLSSKKLIIGVSLLSFLLIPSLITASYLNDKRIVKEALAYVYSPDYSKEYNIDKSSLQKTLDCIKANKDGDIDFIFSSQTPYLSSYFNWLVLDNLTLSYSKICNMEQVFFNTAPVESYFDNSRNAGVSITDVSTNSTYDESQSAWKSWVDLEITNNNGNSWFAEYATTIDLPEGCWISDYYLYVGDRKEPGILAEKKSAMWVFSNIRNENKDPGILHYLTGNKVAFRVFPFTENEVRKTGIEFLHKEPIILHIDNYEIELGNAKETRYKNMNTENVAYVSAQEKRTLKAVKREPYFHFLIDVSKDARLSSSYLIENMEAVLAKNQPLAKNAQISFVNSYINTFPLDNNWKEHYQNQPFDGGFYLERAIETVLFNAYKNKSYPVIVVVTDNFDNAILNRNFSDFKFAFPESDFFFELDYNGMLHVHSLTENPSQKIPSAIFGVTGEENEKQGAGFQLLRTFGQLVLEYKLADNSTVYLPDDNKPSIVLKKDIFNISHAEIKEKDWLSALTMQAKWRSQILHPETSEKEWLDMIKCSFSSKVMTPVTSYLVVENEAQKTALQKKQEQTLAGNKLLDLDEDTLSMSEPNLWVLAILFGGVLLYKKTRKRQAAR